MAKPPSKTPDSPKKPSKAVLSVVPPAVPEKTRARGVQRGGVQNKHEPTDKNRIMVRLAAGQGWEQKRIADVLEISVDTLQRHYREDWNVGTDELSLAIVANLANIARSATHPKAATAAIYWTKTRLGWKEARDDGDGDMDEVFEFTVKIGTKSRDG